MREKHIKAAIDDQSNEALIDKEVVERRVIPANSNQDLDLVKIVSDWNRRDQGVPKWWRNHLKAMFR
jgi:hypothetical protein